MDVREAVEQASATLIGPAGLTPVEVAYLAGVDLDVARRLWRALGFPPVADDQASFTRSDVEMLRSAAALMQQQGAQGDLILQMTRIIGQSLARVAEAQVTAAVAHLPAHEESVLGHLEGVTALSQAMLPSVEPFLGYVWRRHLVAALRRYVTQIEDAGDAGSLLAVGFADLVGFTAVSEQLTASELASLVSRFEELAYESIPQHGGRVIKMIGDEVMFAAESTHAAAAIALDLQAVYAAEESLPDVRVGLAYGPTLSWQGDLFGPIVNLASRLVSFARPGTVLISLSAAEQLDGDAAFTLRRLKPVKLKGLGKVAATVLRRAAATSS